ncbi:hypothetical protein GCM10010168_21610 [Actinoplanes ianthinogenes]|uniref:PBP domain-containing protein n=1 Tax=Actinoplanes ianthinogenes TaxID=122358 RepID=A0ABN6CRI2_9ACTN|nr:substrate-binding domain-containing protein [Actinoplanes ianthinogenes]BCJ47802.1 hypothetical protein Aiant_84590 [Actinoplanes ianthinogenes]GGR04248.1 hypothetical protein GCM10010168_21610 [Actinoplanes ianthinogenes]
MLTRFLAYAVVAALAVSGCSPAPPAGPAAEPAHHHHSAVVASGQPQGPLVVQADDRFEPALGVLIPTFEDAFPGTDVQVSYGTGAAAVTAAVTGTADVALVERADAAHTDLRVVDVPQRFALAFAPAGRNPVTADAFRELLCSALAQRVLAGAA